jgi:integrase
MASLTRYSKGYKVRYRIYYPDGASRVAFAYRGDMAEARRLKSEADRLEALTRQNMLTPELAIAFRHWRLLTEADLCRWWPQRSGPLDYDADALLEAFTAETRLRCSGEWLSEKPRQAQRILARVGNLAQLTEAGVRAWQQARAGEVARKSVNIEHDILRQLVDHCQRLGWRLDNPARAVAKLPWKPSRLPQALTYEQVQQSLRMAREQAECGPERALQACLARVLVAGIYFGLRRGELQHLIWRDTNGRQVFVQGKTLPDGRPWVPKDREARVIGYPGIERPIAIVFGETPQAGYVFSPVADRSRPFNADMLTRAIGDLLQAMSPELTLHSLRHTFATWRLMMGDPLLQVKGWMGHSDANTLLRYAHVLPDPMQDLLPLLG